MQILAAIKKGERILALRYLHPSEIGERERWYAALVVAENADSFAGAKIVDVGYTGENADKVIIAAAGCSRFVSNVTVEPDDVRLVLSKLGWEPVTIGLSGEPGNSELTFPLGWLAGQVAGVLR